MKMIVNDCPVTEDSAQCFFIIIIISYNEFGMLKNNKTRIFPLLHD